MKNPLPYSYLAVEGNIGAGKTSLARILSTKFNSALVLEEFAENTFLPQFYEQPERFAFPLEMSFLAERFQQIKLEQQRALENQQVLVGDYIFEKSLLFAQVNLSGAELDLFTRFYKLINPSLRSPDLVLYLHRSTPALLQNIHTRGREYEKSIPAAYLDKLSEAYLDHLQSTHNQRVIILKSDEIDFVNNPADLRFVMDLVQQEHPEKVLVLNP
ncbi:MAG: deoxynucleoside kinase [Bacteroidia bacterium]|nr:deoxynucleoside kinase [Bacteroidia bacterium]